MWLPEPTEKLQAAYSSTNDPKRDGETTLLADEPQTLEQIQAVCRRYGVKARVIRNRRIIGEVAATGEFTVAT